MKRLLKSFLKMLIVEFVQPIRFRNSTIHSFVPKDCVIGKGVIIGERCRIPQGIFVGDYTFLNDDVRIESCSNIGKYCSISHGVKLGLGAHPVNFLTTSPALYSKSRGYQAQDLFCNSKKKTVVEHDVWIGANALIMEGVKLGTGCIVGAGSVVTRTVQPYAIVAGVPSRSIGSRFTENKIKELLESKWWEMPISEIVNNTKLIVDP